MHQHGELIGDERESCGIITDDGEECASVGGRLL
jgi:hypothetical protein